ncbi:MAG: cupredoxin domain-containing protein, partial [Candidatus Omnitrophota bacterium]|nr:cupredoxin domain-containing protein [Candidatus Omnitrophota bacterium]
MDVKKKSLIILTFLFSFLSFSLSSFAAQEEKVIEVKARKFSYTPHMIEVNKGDVVKIRLISEDVHHGFFLDGYGVETSSYPGKEGVVKFVADKPGRFNFRCSVTCGEF